MSLKTALGAALAAAALAALPAAPAGANVQVGASGWQWGSPLPQGNGVRAMAFAGSAGYAAGDFGTLLKTTDGGSTWTGLPVGTFQGLSVVQALDADTVFAGGGCVARRSTDGGRSFTAVRFTAVESSCRNQLRDLSFVSRDVGYLLLQDGSVFKTNDGGVQFAPRTALPDTAASGGGSAVPAGIAFLDESTGYAASSGRLFQTLDGGVSWRLVAFDGRGIRALWFADARRGFAVGNGGLVLRTDDGGATWAAKDLGVGGVDYTSIRCTGGTLCLLTTQSGAQLVRTSDGADTPGTVVTPSSDPVYAAAFASPTRVAAAGEHGASVVSDDGGVRFTPIGGRIAGAFTALRAGGAPSTAFAPGADGRLAKTTDGGRTWTTGNVPTTADLVDVSFPSTTIGYALDADGGLFRTDNAGATWKALGTGSTRRPSAVLAPDPSAVLVVGPRGIRRSADTGETFEQVRARAVLRTPLYGVGTARVGGAVFAWGRAALLRSTDRGVRWTALRRPTGARIVQVAFATTRVGLLLDVAGRVWRTANAGRSWALLTSVGAQDVRGVAVDTPRTATLVIGSFGNAVGGYLLRSEDAGATWQPQFVVNESIAGRGIVAGDGVDYLLAGNADLLFSTTGGVAGDPSELRLATKRRRLPRAGRITVSGRLQPAGGSAQVTVSALAPGGRGWQHQTVPVASNGTFVTAWRIPRGTTTFVAQWTGDFASAGAGSRPLTVTVSPGRRLHPRHR